MVINDKFHLFSFQFKHIFRITSKNKLHCMDYSSRLKNMKILLSHLYTFKGSANKPSSNPFSSTKSQQRK